MRTVRYVGRASRVRLLGNVIVARGVDVQVADAVAGYLARDPEWVVAPAAAPKPADKPARPSKPRVSRQPDDPAPQPQATAAPDAAPDDPAEVAQVADTAAAVTAEQEGGVDPADAAAAPVVPDAAEGDQDNA